MQKKQEMYIRQLEKVHAALPKQTKTYLETFNDGVIAIYITIMALEIPYPHGDVSLYIFLRAILTFFISFFVIADFWYDIHRTFITFEKADHAIVVSNFSLLASLALIPVMTKWIMRTSNHQAVIAYGILYFVVSLLELLFYYSAHRRRFKEYITPILFRVASVLSINICLIGLAFIHPKSAMVLYIFLPIVSFFFPQYRLKRKIHQRISK